MEPTDGYDHQAYKDSLSREELAEIYSEEELEEEMQNRELRKQSTLYVQFDYKTSRNIKA
jgi:hypothetical protein